MMDRESFLVEDRGDVNGETLGATLEILPSGERKIVGIACILRARRLREANQPAVDPVRA